MKINHKKVEQLKSLYGVKLKGDQTLDELLSYKSMNIRKFLTKTRKTYYSSILGNKRIFLNK